MSESVICPNCEAVVPSWMTRCWDCGEILVERLPETFLE